MLSNPNGAAVNLNPELLQIMACLQRGLSARLTSPYPLERVT